MDTKCARCGMEFDVTTSNYLGPPNYCPGCGARIPTTATLHQTEEQKKAVEEAARKGFTGT